MIEGQVIYFFIKTGIIWNNVFLKKQKKTKQKKKQNKTNTKQNKTEKKKQFTFGTFLCIYSIVS